MKKTTTTTKATTTKATATKATTTTKATATGFDAMSYLKGKGVQLAALEKALEDLKDALSENAPEVTIEGLKAVLNRAKADCNLCIKEGAYEFFLSQEKSIYAAIQEGTIQAITARVFKPFGKDEYRIEWKLAAKRVDINLMDFEEYADKVHDGKRVMANINWKTPIEDFIRFIHNRVSEDLEIPFATTSNNEVKDNLQAIVDGIFYEDNGKGGNIHKVLSVDTRWVKQTLPKRTGASTITIEDGTKNQSRLMPILMDVLRRVVCDIPYSIK